MTTTELARDFTVKVRGYDRAEVDSYLRTLREWLDNATFRVEAAEADSTALREQVVLLRSRVAALETEAANTPPRTVEALGDRLTQILSMAEESAAAITADAEAEAVAIIGRARQQADELLRATYARQAEVEAAMASATERATAMARQMESRAAEASARMQAEASAKAAACEAEANARARATTAAAEAERERVLRRLAEEKAAIARDIERLTGDRDDLRAGLARVEESLHRSIAELDGRSRDTAARTDHWPVDVLPPPPRRSGRR